MNTDIPVTTIRAKARAVFKKSGVEYARSYPSRIRGWRNWSRGVIVNPVFSGGIARVVACYDIAEMRRKDLASAVDALRAHGWTVNDDGMIQAMPEGKTR